MKITKTQLKSLIAEEWDSVHRDVSIQAQSTLHTDSVMSGYSLSEVTAIVNNLTRMNKTIHDDKTLTKNELDQIKIMIENNIIPAVNTLSSTINRKHEESLAKIAE